MDRRVNENVALPAGGSKLSPRWRRAQDRAIIDEALERLAFILDDWIRIPGTDWRFGLDAVLGLVAPGVGDALTTVASVYIVLRAMRYGLPKITLSRMLVNIAIDYVVGSIPLVGDLFDFRWKANARNIELLNRHAQGRRSTLGDWLFLLVLLATLLGLVALLLFAIYSGVQYIWHHRLIWLKPG
jgi:hypothetical protein